MRLSLATVIDFGQIKEINFTETSHESERMQIFMICGLYVSSVEEK